MATQFIGREGFSNMSAAAVFVRAIRAISAPKSHFRFLMLPIVTAALVFSSSVEVWAAVPGTPTLARHYDLRSLTTLRFFRNNCQLGDLNNDGLIDYLMYSNSKRMAAFADDGADGLTKLWEYTAPVSIPEPPQKYQYKYTIWDVDDDGATEVFGVFASSSGKLELRILNGATGAVESYIQTNIDNPTSDDDTNETRCKLTAANFRGLSTPQDIVLLTENNSRGDIWVYDDALNPLWDTNDSDDYIHAHYPWTYDIDGDGKDELVGKYIIDDDGTFGPYIIDNNGVPDYAKHIDRCYIGELDSSNPGIDILVSQEFYEARMLDANGNLLWDIPPDHKDNKIIVAGEFSPSDAGPEVITYNAHDTVSLRRNDTYRCEDGNEIVSLSLVDDSASFVIDWDGDRTKDEAYKPKRGGFLWDPLDGDTIDLRNDYYNVDANTFHSSDSRTTGHVADVYGDNREEVIICDEDEILVYANADSNPNPRPSPWVSSDVYGLLIANQMNDNHPERAFWPRATDLDGDGFIGWGDVAVLCENWLKTGQDIVKGDLNGDDIVNFLDFAEFATDW